ncbi:MAG: hypothetical protein R3E79_02165 [Caldilineaceae bacterium]
MVVINDKPAVLAAAWQLDQVCYYWSITLDPETALQFVQQCQEMNAATRPALSQLLAAINDYLPRTDYGPTNPNTGKMHHDFVIGAENSRFVDVRIHKSSLRQWTPKDWQALTHFLTLQGWESAADIKQVGQDDEHDYVFNYWWD